MLTIHREPQPPKLIRMGHAPVVIEPPQPVIPDAPPEPVKIEQGRKKKMAKDKDLEEVGTKTIRKDDAGEQGAIGSHGTNAPAQEKVPEKSAEEEKANG